MTTVDDPKELLDRLLRGEDLECIQLLPLKKGVDVDAELEAIKRELLGESYSMKPSTEDSATKVLKDAIGKLDSLSTELRNYCQFSKAKPWRPMKKRNSS